jgi:hypothetical protein
MGRQELEHGSTEERRAAPRAWLPGTLGDVQDCTRRLPGLSLFVYDDLDACADGSGGEMSGPLSVDKLLGGH